MVGAITAQVRRMAEGSTVDIEVENDGLPALPAAVEVALFRIAVEGVTNVVRHAEARSCRVLLGGEDGSAVRGGRGRRSIRPAVDARRWNRRHAGARDRAGRDSGDRPHGRGRPSPCVVPASRAARTDAQYDDRWVIRVVIVDNHSLVRQGLEAVLASAEDVAVVGQAADGRSAVDVVADAEPDVVLMDLQLPELSGLEATRALLEARPETAVLVLTMFEDDDTVHAAIEAGAVGYLLKGADGEDILAAVRSAAAGQAVFGAALAPRLRTFFADRRTAPASFPTSQTGSERSSTSRSRPHERRDRSGAVPLAQDGRQQRLHDPVEAEPLRTRPGDRAGPRRRARTTG